MKPLLVELAMCALGLVLTVWSVLDHDVGKGIVGVVFTAVGFGMLLVRSLEQR
jgi:hypothetical protein